MKVLKAVLGVSVAVLNLLPQAAIAHPTAPTDPPSPAVPKTPTTSVDNPTLPPSGVVVGSDGEAGVIEAGVGVGVGWWWG
jgi:hypothetical protein